MQTHDAIPIPIREHYFSVAIARHVFQHPRYGIVFVRDAISLADAERHGLTPMILYAVTVAGTSLCSLVFAPVGEPRSLISVLQQAWRSSEGLRGYPDVLRVSRHVAEASNELASKLAKIGVRLEVAAGNDRKFAASLRTAQGKVLAIGWVPGGDKGIKGLSDLQEGADYKHAFEMKYGYRLHARPSASKTEAFLALPLRPVEISLPDQADWTPGAWLSSWENNLPPASPRYFYQDSKTIWLLQGEPDQVIDQDEADDESLASFDGGAADIVKLVLACWPNKPVEVAKAIGTTLRELNWYVSGRYKLPEFQQSSLLILLGITPSPYDLMRFEAIGPCVLKADSLRATIAAYDELSHGGDLEFSFEVIPSKGAADPSWRFILFRCCGGYANVIMVPRGSEVAQRLDGKHFINFTGCRSVPTAMYQEIVATCARACSAPQDNRQEMLSFEMRMNAELCSYGN